MAKKIEIKQGDKFGKWTIIEEIAPKIISGKPRRMFRCQCECGNIGEVQLACLRNGHSTSCGCEQKRRVTKAQTKHGLADKHPLYITLMEYQKKKDNKQTLKEKQLEIVKKYNPFDESLGEHTWIKSINDIKTLDEMFGEDEENEFIYPDFTPKDAHMADVRGKVTIYSSHPITEGVFVSPSKMCAQDYAGGGKIYLKEVSTKDIAWIDGGQGQYTPIKEWKNMKKRCNYPNASEYKNYGGRSICVCEEWSNNFQSFYDWAINNGWSRELTIDRIDTNGNYCPENCRWSNIETQMNNTTKNHYIEYNRDTYTLSTLAKHLNIPYNIVRYRLSNCKWSVEQLINYYNDRN